MTNGVSTYLLTGCVVAFLGLSKGNATTPPLDTAADARSQGKPWMKPHQPTELEWLALQFQANEGDWEYGENGVTVNFYLDGKSRDDGIVHCDLSYLPTAEAQLVQLIEDGIQRRFEAWRKPLPWARVVIHKAVAEINRR